MPSTPVPLLNAATGIRWQSSGAFVVLAVIRDLESRKQRGMALKDWRIHLCSRQTICGLILEYSDILFFRNVDPLQCRVYYIVGMGKRVASALVLRRDVFDIASHECVLVLCAQRGRTLS